MINSLIALAGCIAAAASIGHVSVQATALEGEPVAVQFFPRDGDEGLTLTLEDVSTTPPTVIQEDIEFPYATTYVVTPGTRLPRFRNQANDEVSETGTCSVSPQKPSLTSPAAGDVTIGSTITYTATGSATGFDANTSKMEFYDGATLRATDLAAPWTQNYDTTGHAETTANQKARRYWQGLAPADTGTIDSDDVGVNFVASSQSIASIAGALCQANWKASAVTMSGSDVTGMTDLSSNGFNLTVTTVGAVKLTKTASNANFNSKPTVNFVSGASNAEGQNVENTSLTRAAPGTTGHRIFVIGRRTAFGPTNAVFAGSTSADSRFQLRNGGATPNMSINNGATVSTVTSPAVGTAEGVIATFKGGTNTDTLRRNNTTGTAGTAGNNSSTGFSFGSNRLKTTFLDWEIAEIALVDIHSDGPTDAANLAAIISYINSEYGLSLS